MQFIDQFGLTKTITSFARFHIYECRGFWFWYRNEQGEVVIY